MSESEKRGSLFFVCKIIVNTRVMSIIYLLNYIDKLLFL